MDQSLVSPIIDHDIENEIPIQETINSLREIIRQQRLSKERTKEPVDFATKGCIALLIILLALPFIICDFYFGAYTTDCLTKYPENLDVNIKDFLVVSGLVETATIMITVFYILFQNYTSENVRFKSIIYFAFYTIGTFNIIWNIIGGYIFWGFTIKCDSLPKDVSHYLFVSLIIKLLSSFHYIFKKKE